jgi:hypothetical protein
LQWFYQPKSSTVKLNSEDLTELNQHADRLFDMNHQPIKIQFKDLFDAAFEQIMNLFQCIKHKIHDNSITSELLQTLPNIKALMTTMYDELQTLKVSYLNVTTPETIEEEITNRFENFASKFLIDIQSFISTINDNIISNIQKIFNSSNIKIWDNISMDDHLSQVYNLFCERQYVVLNEITSIHKGTEEVIAVVKIS